MLSHKLIVDGEDCIVLPCAEYPRLSERIGSNFVERLSSSEDDRWSEIYDMINEHYNLKLWCDLGAKPNKHWQVSPVKIRYKLNGHRHKMLVQFELLLDEVFSAFPIAHDIAEKVKRIKSRGREYRRIAIDYHAK